MQDVVEHRECEGHAGDGISRSVLRVVHVQYGVQDLYGLCFLSLVCTKQNHQRSCSAFGAGNVIHCELCYSTACVSYAGVTQLLRHCATLVLHFGAFCPQTQHARRLSSKCSHQEQPEFMECLNTGTILSTQFSRVVSEKLLVSMYICFTFFPGWTPRLFHTCQR